MEGSLRGASIEIRPQFHLRQLCERGNRIQVVIRHAMPFAHGCPRDAKLERQITDAASRSNGRF